MPPRIDILLSTYNGEKFLAEQLDSILGQSHVNIILTIRDDGSRDSTPEILEDYARKDARITYEVQDNLGVVGSFHRLLIDADPGSHYYAFADQDDLWLPDKLERALSRLAACDQKEPLLYCSRVEYVTADKVHLGYSPMLRKKAEFRNALVQNIATGCTIVMNEAARTCLLKHDWPAQVLMHDWWCYLVVSAFGTVIWDEYPSVRYRQHGGNVIGGTVSFLSDCKRRIANFRRRQKKGIFGCYDQAQCFWLLYREDLNGFHKETVERFLESKKSFWHRMMYLGQISRVCRQTPGDDFLLCLLIVIGKY
jgi:glycosyltransferase involved in cell wall biosynthesis